MKEFASRELWKKMLGTGLNATAFHDVKGNIKKLTNDNVASSANGVLIIKLKT